MVEKLQCNKVFGLFFKLIDGRESNVADGMNFGQQEPILDDAEAREYRQQVDFQRAFAAAPSPVVTYGLIAINLLVYVAMVVKGVSPITPTPSQVVPWGANSGPLTMYGQWWRLITACFLHYGLIHIGMNMFILFQVGVFAEKLFGNGRYLLLYLLAGVGGNIAGLYMHPMGAAAGASGAVFGVYGGLLGFLLIQRGVVPTRNSAAIAKSAGIFLVYNLIFGLSSKTTDLTAHIGGLVTGFVVGCALARPLSPDGQRLYPIRTLTVGVLGGAAAYLAFSLVPLGEIAHERWQWQIFFGPKITVGTNDKIWYSGTATEEQARALGKALLEQGWFGERDGVAELAKQNGTTVVALMVREGAWDEQKTIPVFEGIGRSVAGAVGGLPIHLVLLDEYAHPQKELLIK